MTLLISALAFFLLLSVLILIHEWGHFAAARKAGVIVDEFGFGLPPRVKTLWTKNGTRFSLNWIPFGGFVRLRGENAVDPDSYAGPGSFAAASVPARVMILCAGVFMNFALAIVILTIGFSTFPIEDKAKKVLDYLLSDKGQAIWTSSAKEFRAGGLKDPVLGLSGWYTARRQDVILADRLAALEALA